MPEDLGVPAPLSRRFLILGAGALLAPPAFAADHGEASAVTPAAALQRLTEGNARFVAGRSTHSHLDQARRRSLTGGQQPFATILACADSRVGPELIFDQGLGDLFVIRVAGNVADDVVIGSIEYSVIHLGVPLVMVLGHQKCGAVAATIEALAGKTGEGDKDTKIGALANLIAPAVKATPANAPDRLDAAVVQNVRRTARSILADSRPLAERARAGKLQVVSARYGLDDGKVSQVQQA